LNTTREVAQLFADRLEHQEFVEAFSMLHSDGIYRIIGSTKASGIYRGRQDVFDRLFPVLACFKTPIACKFEAVIVDGDRAVLFGSAKADGPYGAYEQPVFAFVCRVKDDGLQEIVELTDTVMMEKALFGRVLPPPTAAD
jgi:ketosteroid isomerase-like protein